MDLVELANWADALTPEVQQRAKNGSASSITTQYAVCEDGREVAYVALDSYPAHQCADLTVYELFVPKQLRHRGVGARILAETEKLARAGGYSRVLLSARPSEKYPKAKLHAWYQKHGFKPLPGGNADDLAKDLR